MNGLKAQVKPNSDTETAGTGDSALMMRFQVTMQQPLRHRVLAYQRANNLASFSEAMRQLIQPTLRSWEARKQRSPGHTEAEAASAGI